MDDDRDRVEVMERDDAPASRWVGVVVASIVVLATLGLGAMLVGAQLPGDALPRQPVGLEAPPVVLPSLDGEEVVLAEVVEGPVLLTFWASWCSTCKSDMPAIRRLATSWEDRGVAVVGVVFQDSRSAALSVVEEYELPYLNLLDAEEQVVASYSVTGTPETFLIDGDGRIAAKWIGPLPIHDVEFQLGMLTS